MTIANYVRAGIVGLALMGCKDKRTKPEQYDAHCINLNSDSARILCADRSADGTLNAIYDPKVFCFGKLNKETRCSTSSRYLPLTPELEDAANKAFSGTRDLSFLVDKHVRAWRK